MHCGEDYFLTEKEKNEIVSGKYLYALTDFSLFKKWEAYWLEYVGDDTYVGRSDNILNIKVIITPYQLHNYFSKDEPSAYEKRLAEWFYNMRTWGLTHSEDGEACENFTDSQAHKAVNDLQKYMLSSHSDDLVYRDSRARYSGRSVRLVRISNKNCNSMKIPFDMKYRSEVESGKYKVVTAEGRPVRIICWDKREYGGNKTLIALIPANTGTECIYQYYPEGVPAFNASPDKWALQIKTMEKR